MRPTSYTRSKPPTTRRFRWSSVAMRRVRSRPRELWWVEKGRASAPPGADWRTGVSISRNPRESRKRRRVDWMTARERKTERTDGLLIMSRCLCLYLLLTSVRPWNLSGRGSKALVSIVHEAQLRVSSPLSVRRMLPVQPIMSPESVKALRSLKLSGSVSRSFFLSNCSCSCPVSSCSTKKARLPNTLLLTILPATECWAAEGSSSPAPSLPDHREEREPQVAVGEKVYAYGSCLPDFLMASTLSSRPCLISARPESGSGSAAFGDSASSSLFLSASSSSTCGFRSCFDTPSAFIFLIESPLFAMRDERGTFSSSLLFVVLKRRVLVSILCFCVLIRLLVVISVY
mmetsp:Transcript_25117/g.50055  ORF Transcript_25117/g.50055 Transcript_25117/m.50055 type:complete len:345 (-) Transcript_25117:211-1245(-)